MSSFKRKTTVKQPKTPTGSRPSPSSASILNISTGISSLDDILGGGLPLATTLLVLNPDPHSAHGELTQKYFVAQGLACGQDVCVFAPHGNNIVEECMWTPEAYPTKRDGDEDEAPTTADEKVKIAWRYERMQKFQTTVSSPSTNQDEYCTPFDLTCRIPSSALEAALSSGQLMIKDLTSLAESDVYESVMTWVEELLEPKEQDGSGFSKVLRISIPSFACPIWGEPTTEKIIRFLHRLRSALRSSPRACALLTLPSHLCSDGWGGPGWIQKLGWTSDSCITLASFTADPALSALFPSHHGLLQIHSLPNLYTLVPPSDRFSVLRGLSSASPSSGGGIGENNIAFKSTRKRFFFETLHLDLEGGLGERRTTPAVSSFAQQDNANQHAGISENSETEARVAAAITVAFDEAAITSAVIDNVSEQLDTEKKPTKSRTKKKVGFRSDKPELYDF